ncbi:transcriptional regulator [Enemella evansiae]|uniref:helix-turn-helix domain-containing protein n=1 Tax=Enemella evansiae TaxID=2016499 RepID=UPI000B9600AD|nr:helix-turn-helix transcriptional regulator [Enemella evansiae]OYN98098.1 transcriptional regulator [Enemella evansiae]
MDAENRGELAEFLRSRRAGLTPAELGIASYGQRRVDGLRREELAHLAGVSVAYYTRLEQGVARTASEPVLDALAGALRLDADERRHLKLLARPPRRPRTATPTERVPKHVASLISGMVSTPALVLGRFQDVLTWNPEGHRLFAAHLPFEAPDQVRDRPNMVRLLFTDPHGRDLYRDWEQQAAYTVSALRYSAGEYPDDRALVELVGELSTSSQEFATRWARRMVRRCTGGMKQFRHPEFGDLDLRFESFELSTHPGQRLLLLSAEPGSPSQAGLDLLAHAARTERAEPGGEPR